jgi:5-methylcytosine-specific restriction endonuclease McrA
MTTRTLLLTPWMAPHDVISWRRAIVLFFRGKVEVLEEWDERVDGPSMGLRAPSVARLVVGCAPRKRKVRFTRRNVFTRDGFRCQYCGASKPWHELTYDHVVPRARGGRTWWDNIVASCRPCNARKGGRTPEEAGMTLRRRPFVPRTLAPAPLLAPEQSLPSVWQSYVAPFGLVPG